MDPAIGPSTNIPRHGTTLQEAAYSGHLTVVQYLINNGASINSQAGFFGTALQAAAYGGHKEIVELLLSRGADVNAKGGFYYTALQAAAYGDYTNVVGVLLNAGAGVNTQGGKYGSALRAAAYKGHDSIVELLILRGADVNAQVANFDTLSRDSGTALQSAAREGHEAVVQLLIEQGADIDAVSGFYGTALQAAASEGYQGVIQLLLDKGADINAVSGEFGTALQAAACEGHEGAVLLLIEYGADVNMEGGEFGSALQAAVDEGHEGIVQILLDNGARVNNDSNEYSNALQVALYQGHKNVAQILLENGAESSLQHGWLGSTLQARDAPDENEQSTRSSIKRKAVVSTPNGCSRERISTSRDIENAGVLENRTQNPDKINPMTINEKELTNTSKSDLPPDGTSMGFTHAFQNTWRIIRKFAKFIGPGYIIAVAYIDPGNYSTGISAGATYKFRLLFIILLSNLFAIFLQSLCVKLGSVTGLNLAENCRKNLPPWLNNALYVLAESAIIATDIDEVIGSAIALNILLKIPLVAGCALTIIDVLVILLFYRPTGSMRRLRYFEYFVLLLVFGIMICFFLQLSYIKGVNVGHVFRGYLPSGSIVKTDGLYLSCGILGATVMPHSLYLGSGVVQGRLHEFDIKEGNTSARSTSHSTIDLEKYRPSLAAIRNCMRYSIAELVIALFTFALFVNSSILITAGASLYKTESIESVQGADLFGIHTLLSRSIAPVAGTIFAVSLLLSGTAAGIVATIAGQMVSEGSLNWTCAPWLRRLLTRCISIVPSIIIAASVGRDGLTAALNGTQITLSVILPFVSAPLIYFTSRNKYMTVSTNSEGEVKMRNHWFTCALAVVIWLIVVAMNVSLLILIVIGKARE